MEEKRNLCAQIPASLHSRVREEQEKSGLTLGAYMTELLTNYFKGGQKSMEGIRTMAIQIPEDLFHRLKDYLATESERTGRKLSQKEFILNLIQQALDEAEPSE